ncbi:hypothetical protein [Nocardiopsis flavescens]
MNARHLPPVAGALCLALGLAACGAAAPNDAEGGGSGFLPAGAQVRELVLPFDVYTFSPFEMRTLRYAEDLLVRDCMRGRGMDWRVQPAPDEEGTDPPHRRRYGVAEPEVAARHGYGAPALSRDEALVEQVRQERRTLPATEHRAAHGDEGGAGCLEQGREGMAEGVPDRDEDLLNTYIRSGFEASAEDPAVVEAFAAWSACMADRGFDYREPDEAAEDPRWADREGEPSSVETEAATADVDCKETASVVRTWHRAETAVQEELVEEHTEDFALFARVKEKRMERAEAVISESGSPA